MKQPATLPTPRRQGTALVVLALAVVLAGLGNCAEQEEDEKPRKERQPQKKQAASRRKAG